ncbi:MAG: RidA family protein [Candidatus Glassbacteria bacterium]
MPTDKAPAPIGPYSQAICLEEEGLLFTAGQIAIDPGTGQMVAGGIEEQTRMVLENLKAVIKAAGSDTGKTVKTTIYLKNMDDFPKVNAIYETYFSRQPYPARSTVEVASLPKGALVEIDAVVKIPGGKG